MKKVSLMKSINFAKYVKSNLVMMLTIKVIIKSEIIVIKLKNIEELLIIFII